MSPLRAALRKTVWVLPVLAACVGPGALQGGVGPPVRAAGTPLPQADPTQTDVVLTPKEPLPKGKNLLWSAGMNLAWDALADTVGGPLRLGPPVPQDVVEELNRRPFPHGDLDEGSYVVAAGFARDGVVDRFQRSLAAKFPGERFPMAFPALDPDDAAAFAYVRKDLPFLRPFHVRIERLSFAGGPRRVVAFGIDPEASGRDVAQIARQAVFHAPPAGAPQAEAGDFVVELLPRDDSDRIVLGAIPRPTSLAAGWERVSALRAQPGAALTAGVDLAIPKIDFAADKTFHELLRAPLVDLPPGAEIKDARERIEFTLSEVGARFAAAASVAMSCSARPTPRRIRFESPFFLALVRKEASHPYFLAWFENDALFVKSEAGRDG